MQGLLFIWAQVHAERASALGHWSARWQQAAGRLHTECWKHTGTAMIVFRSISHIFVTPVLTFSSSPIHANWLDSCAPGRILAIETFIMASETVLKWKACGSRNDSVSGSLTSATRCSPTSDSRIVLMPALLPSISQRSLRVVTGRRCMGVENEALAVPETSDPTPRHRNICPRRR